MDIAKYTLKRLLILLNSTWYTYMYIVRSCYISTHVLASYLTFAKTSQHKTLVFSSVFLSHKSNFKNENHEL